jgi:hypothetical protein
MYWITKDFIAQFVEDKGAYNLEILIGIALLEVKFEGV